MTDYRDAKYTFPAVTFSGATESSPVSGNIWYDSGKYYLGTSQNLPNVWSSGGNIATARYGLGGAGTLSAGLCFGGYNDSGSSAATEEYSGLPSYDLLFNAVPGS